MRKVLVAVVGACLLSLGLSTQVAHALDVTVCPPGGNPANCSTYTTIQAAVDAATPGATITLPAGVHTEGGIQIVGKNLTIRGVMPRDTIVQADTSSCGQNPQRVFTITGARVTMQNMTIRHGCLLNQLPSAAGGAIWNSGALTLQDMIVRDNGVVYSQNPISPTQPLTLTPMAGAIYNVGSLDILNSSILSNKVRSVGDTALGGGIFNDGGATISNSTIGENEVFGQGDRDKEQSFGGGIHNAGTLLLQYSTVANNRAGTGGSGLYSTGRIKIINSLITGNAPPIFATTGGQADCEDDSSGVDCEEFVVGEAYLGTLTPDTRTPVYVPGDQSPSIDNGVCIQSDTTHDQRGYPRVVGSDCDLGSVERGFMFAPIIAAAPPQPDLIVKSITVEPSKNLDASTRVNVTVVIQNIGNEPTMDTFYVDLFVNPRETPPNHGGTSWFQLCRTNDCGGERGIVWVIKGSVDEGQSLTLTSELAADPYIFQPSTRWDKRFAAGEVTLWAIVDSYQENRLPSGRIAERSEDNNRVAHPKFVVAPATLPTAADATTLSQIAPVPPSVEP